MTSPPRNDTYYYTVHYSADANFNASDNATETLTITNADTTPTAVIELFAPSLHDALPILGTNVQDDATVTSTNTSFPITGTVTYTFFQESNGIAGLQTGVGGETGRAHD